MPESSFEHYQQRVSKIVHALEADNWEDLGTVTHILSKITHLFSEQIRPCLHSLMENLIELQERPFHATATPDEWSQRFSAWVEAHQGLGLPHLSDDVLSRESIYGDDC